jgi:gluconate 5-dehydrogenase
VIDMTTWLERQFSLEGRVAVVTGGSSGIGRAMALALGRAGAAVVLVARRAGPLAETVAELEGHGCRAAAVAADLADRREVRDAAERAAKPFGEPDILVNSAGVNLRPPFAQISDADWDTTMAVNLDAPHLLGLRYGPGMAERGYGRIINVASQQAFRAFASSGAYGVSKAGIVALSRSQAEAWSPHGVTSNAVVPGFVPTPLNARLRDDPEIMSALAARTLVGRNSVPADFEGVAVFLASPAAAYLTGQAVFVDGGFSAH